MGCSVGSGVAYGWMPHTRIDDFVWTAAAAWHGVVISSRVD